MSTTEATIAEVPASNAPEVDNDALSDAALAEVFKETPEDGGSDDAGDADGESGGTAEDAARQLADASQGKKTAKAEDEGIDLSLLTDEAEAAQPTEEDAHVKLIKEYLPNQKAVETLIESAQRTHQLSTAIQQNDFNGVYRALGQQAEPLLEMFYQVAKDKLVERYINEAQGQAVDPRVQGLEQKLAQLENYINTGVQQRQQGQQAAAKQKAFMAVNEAIERDLDTARYPKDEYHTVQRKLIQRAVIADLAESGQLAKAMAGEMKLVRAALRTHLTSLVEADKKRQTVQTTKRAQMETSKPIVSGESANRTAADTTKDGEPDYLQRISDFLERDIKKRSNSMR